MQVTGAGAPESAWLCCLTSPIFSTDAVVSLPTPKPRSSDPDAHLDTSIWQTWGSTPSCPGLAAQNTMFPVACTGATLKVTVVAPPPATATVSVMSWSTTWAASFSQISLGIVHALLVVYATRSFASLSAWNVRRKSPGVPSTLTRGRSQFDGNSEWGSGSVTHGPAPLGAPNMPPGSAGVPGSAIRSIGKSVHGPVHGGIGGGVIEPPKPGRTRTPPAPAEPPAPSAPAPFTPAQPAPAAPTAATIKS